MTKICATCGKQFEPNDCRQKYCSKLCCDRHCHPRVPILDKVCVFCGKVFKTKIATARCCSFTCCDRLRRGWASLADFEKAQAARAARSRARQSAATRASIGLTHAQIQDVISAQDGDPSQLWRRSQSWTQAQRKYARKRYEENHGLFSQAYNP